MSYKKKAEICLILTIHKKKKTRKNYQNRLHVTVYLMDLFNLTWIYKKKQISSLNEFLFEKK